MRSATRRVPDDADRMPLPHAHHDTQILEGSWSSATPRGDGVASSYDQSDRSLRGEGDSSQTIRPSAGGANAGFALHCSHPPLFILTRRRRGVWRCRGTRECCDGDVAPVAASRESRANNAQPRRCPVRDFKGDFK